MKPLELLGFSFVGPFCFDQERGEFIDAGLKGLLTNFLKVLQFVPGFVCFSLLSFQKVSV